MLSNQINRKYCPPTVSHISLPDQVNVTKAELDKSLIKCFGILWVLEPL